MKRLIAVVFPAVLWAAPAFAQDDRPPMPPSPEERLERALDAVDATDAQRGRLEALLEDTLPKIRSMHEEGHQLRDAMRAALTAEVVDRDEVESIRLDALDLADRMSAMVLDAVVIGANVLTQDQRVTLAELHERHHERHLERMRQMHPPEE